MSQDQNNKPALSDAFQRAMKIPGADYETPQSLGVDPDETMLIDMWCAGVTSANTSTPVVGTEAFNPCLALIIYNPRTKTAVIAHEPHIEKSYFLSLLSKVRYGDDDIVHLHLMGAPVHSPYGDDPEEANAHSRAMLSRLALAFESTPNLIVKTFDVYTKPKPSAVAIDTRNGKLIRGADLYILPEEDEGLEIGYSFIDWNHCEMPEGSQCWEAPGTFRPT